MLRKLSIVLLLALFAVVTHSENIEEILPRVIGGTPSLIGQYPSVVSIQVPVQVGQAAQTYCSGTIVNAHHVVTASSCVHDAEFNLINPFWFRIIAGDLNIFNPSYGRFTTNATHIYTHESYTHTPRTNDIAVMRTSEPFPFPHNTIDFAVRGTRPLPNEQICRFVGWGAAAAAAGSPIGPAQAFVLGFIIDREVCNSTGVHPGAIQANMICAGSLFATTPPSGVCTGNAGGGLFCDVDGWWEYTGVLSFGIGCGVASQPGVYMQIVDFNPWINQQFTRTDRTIPGTRVVPPATP